MHIAKSTACSCSTRRFLQVLLFHYFNKFSRFYTRFFLQGFFLLITQFTLPEDFLKTQSHYRRIISIPINLKTSQNIIQLQFAIDRVDVMEKIWKQFFV